MFPNLKASYQGLEKAEWGHDLSRFHLFGAGGIAIIAWNLLGVCTTCGNLVFPSSKRFREML